MARNKSFLNFNVEKNMPKLNTIRNNWLQIDAYIFPWDGNRFGIVPLISGLNLKASISTFSYF